MHERVVLLVALSCVWASVIAQTATQGFVDASPEQGAGVFAQCRVCHSYGPRAKDLIGPNLWQVLGRDIASQPRFAYSPALRALSGGWSPAALDAFLQNPAQYAPGTRMAFAGIRDAKARADLIAFLAIARDSPSDALAGQEQSVEAAQTDSFGDDWPLDAGREETGHVCSGCHSLAIVKQQGLNREDWDELLVWMVEEQGMSELSNEVRNKILAFLAKHFGRDRKR